jgi:tRNA/tmRNA/rRNA uracil-C5-methylase (TrmA/RlmC/RlmD family)
MELAGDAMTLDDVENVDDRETLEGARLSLRVGAVAHGGHCVARADSGQVVFVRHALPGERVVAVVTEQRPGFLRADAVEILVPSADRVSPPCPWAGPDRCGGCDFQHVSPPAQRELKAAVVREALVRLAGLSADEVDDLAVRVLAATVTPTPTGDGGPGDGLGWRTRVQYTVDSEGRAGLLKHRSHEVVPVDRCRIAHPAVSAQPVLERRWDGVDSVDVIASGAGDVAVLSGQTARGRRGGGRRSLVSGPGTVRERALGREWRVPAESFWQVHPEAADTLASAVVELLEPRVGERAWDLYGGVGLFAAALAPRLGATGRLTVVESDRRAAAAASRCLADLTTVTVLASNVERALANPAWRAVDLVVLDPPRAGAGAAVVRAILARRPRAVAYVACDPAAFARDVRTFREAGWQLTQLRGYDLFPMTHHVELVGKLSPSGAG